MARLTIPQTVAEWNERGGEYLPEDAQGFTTIAHIRYTQMILRKKD